MTSCRGVCTGEGFTHPFVVPGHTTIGKPRRGSDLVLQGSFSVMSRSPGSKRPAWVGGGVPTAPAWAVSSGRHSVPIAHRLEPYTSSNPARTEEQVERRLIADAGQLAVPDLDVVDQCLVEQLGLASGPGSLAPLAANRLADCQRQTYRGGIGLAVHEQPISGGGHGGQASWCAAAPGGPMVASDGPPCLPGRMNRGKWSRA
jgi:hypothetical protein